MYFHKHLPTQKFTETHLSTHIRAYAHIQLHTYYVQTTSDALRAVRSINFTSNVNINPFQKCFYEVFLRNVAPLRGPPALPPVLNLEILEKDGISKKALLQWYTNTGGKAGGPLRGAWFRNNTS